VSARRVLLVVAGVLLVRRALARIFD